MTNHPCTIKNCRKPAPWRLDCTGHPNGGAVYWYCQAHVFVPAWDDAPTPYTMTVSGPHR